MVIALADPPWKS